MKLFAYGCSFTYGSELADSDFAKMSREQTEILKTKIGHTGFYNRYIHKRFDKEYTELMHKKSYVHTIADIINADSYINRAVPGGSNTHVFYRILEDINLGNISSEDIIFVGYTSFNRFTWYDKTETEFKSTTVANGDWPSQKFQKQYILNTSDQDYILQNVQTYYAIKEITKKFKFFYQTTQWPYTHTYGHIPIDNSLSSSLQEIDKNALLPETCLHYETPDAKNWENYVHSFGHPYEEYHKTFGKKLGEAILEKI